MNTILGRTVGFGPLLRRLSENPLLRRLLENRIIFALLLALIFTISFAIPLFCAVQVGGVWFDSDVSRSYAKEKTDRLFPNARVIGGPNTFLSVSHADDLQPIAGRDFLLTAWFKLRRLPALDERWIVLSKYDGESKVRNGYALALARDGDLVRPELYWRSAEGKGTWLRFSELDIDSKEWFMLAISFRQDSFLGMHAVTPAVDGREAAKVVLLGGYQLNEMAAGSNEPLLVGSFNVGKFRGMIGPLGIFTPRDLSERLGEILNAAAAAPPAVPDELSLDEVRLWIADGQKDESGTPHSVRFVDGRA